MDSLKTLEEEFIDDMCYWIAMTLHERTKEGKINEEQS